MITKIDKDVKKLKIGLLGFRSDYLKKPLIDLDFTNFKTVEIGDIDS